MSRLFTFQALNNSKIIIDNKYMLGDEIGRGAHAKVFKGLDLENGDFVAIKQVSLENIDEEDLKNIMQEIDLLKNLKHKNIVKYLGSYKTKSYLHIILEYVENGSLANIIKPTKFGPFPESLVAVYITQVLEGLVYLHEQGVIHRDIKGANILTTKEGLVKLADFGVATKLTEANIDKLSFVGTTYWMAPEVMNESGACVASDIWSVGCTVIELLTGSPPYYDLQPWPALFRIAQDEQPAIPDNLSPAVTDFLHQCFKKDHRQRLDAKTLLSHPWIQSSRLVLHSSLRHNGTLRNNEEDCPVDAETSNGDDQGFVDNLAAKNSKDSKTVLRSVEAADTDKFSDDKDTECNPLGDMSGDPEANVFTDQSPTLAIYEKSQIKTISARPSFSVEANTSSELHEPAHLTAQEKVVVKDEFGSPNSSRKSIVARKVEVKEISIHVENGSSSAAPKSQDYSPPKAVEYSKLVSSLRPDEPEDVIVSACQKLIAFFHQFPEQKFVFLTQHGLLPLVELLEVPETRVICSALQVLNEIIKDNTEIQENACQAGLIQSIMSFAVPDRPHEIRMQAAYFLHQLCHSSSLTLHMFIACRGITVLVGFLEADYSKHREMVHLAIDGMWQVFKLQRSTPKNDFCHIALKNGILLGLINTLYSLNEATQLASISGGGGFSSDGVVLRQQSGPLDPGNPAFGPSESMISGMNSPNYHNIKQGATDNLLPSATHESSHASVSNLTDPRNFSLDTDRSQPNTASVEATASIKSLENSATYSKERKTIDRWKSDPSQAESDLRQRGNTAMILSKNRPSKLTDGALNGLSAMTQQQHIRPLLSLLDKEPPSRRFSDQLEYVRHFTGLEKHGSVLPLLQASNERKINALDFPMAEFAEVSGCGREHANLESLPKSSQRSADTKVGPPSSSEGAVSASRIASQRDSGVLSGSGVLNARPWSSTSSGLLSHMVPPCNADLVRECIEKVADLLLVFAEADTTVKSYMCSQSILSRVFQMFNKIEPHVLLKLLRCINHLSTDRHCLENLQRADAIKHLIPNLDLKEDEGPLVSHIHYEVLNALFNLCKINKRRQEQAAENGIIPHLMHYIMSGSPLRQYALPLLCDMAHASRTSREQLRAHGGLDVYLSLLEDDMWSVTALDSISICLAHDNDKKQVEQALLRKDAVQKLVNFFQSCPEQHFIHILEPFLKIITKSSRITALAVNGVTPLLISRLDHQDAIARLNLLRLIKAVYEHHPRPKQMILEHNLPRKLQNLIEERRDGQSSGGQVLVKQMATSLLKALHINTIL